MINRLKSNLEKSEEGKDKTPGHQESLLQHDLAKELEDKDHIDHTTDKLKELEIEHHGKDKTHTDLFDALHAEVSEVSEASQDWYEELWEEICEDVDIDDDQRKQWKELFLKLPPSQRTPAAAKKLLQGMRDTYEQQDDDNKPSLLSVVGETLIDDVTQDSNDNSMLQILMEDAPTLVFIMQNWSAIEDEKKKKEFIQVWQELLALLMETQIEIYEITVDPKTGIISIHAKGDDGNDITLHLNPTTHDLTHQDTGKVQHLDIIAQQKLKSLMELNDPTTSNTLSTDNI